MRVPHGVCKVLLGKSLDGANLMAFRVVVRDASVDGRHCGKYGNGLIGKARRAHDFTPCAMAASREATIEIARFQAAPHRRP